MGGGSKVVLDAAGVQRCLRRMASEIVDALEPGVPLLLVGIRRGGVTLAHRLAALISEAEGKAPRVGAIDITLYRYDLYTGLEKPSLGPTELPVDIEGCGIVLVDDVLYTGRTVRAALGVLHDFGRPRWIRLAALVDRGGRELPIAGDYVGRKVSAARGDKVVVQSGKEPQDDDRVWVEPGGLR